MVSLAWVIFTSKPWMPCMLPILVYCSLLKVSESSSACSALNMSVDVLDCNDLASVDHSWAMALHAQPSNTLAWTCCFRSARECLFE